jgi:hypothetical protein
MREACQFQDGPAANAHGRVSILIPCNRYAWLALKENTGKTMPVLILSQ